MDDLSLEAVGWLSTFALHSTVLLALVLLACWGLRFLRRGEVRVEEALLRVAMFGAVITATVQWSLGHAAFPGLEIELGGAAALAPVVSLPIGAGTPIDIGSVVGATPAAAAHAVTWSAILAYALAAYLLAVLLVAAWRLRGSVQFHRLVEDRRPIDDSHFLLALTRLNRQAGISRRVRLSVSDRLASPVAFGSFRPEVCLPASVLERLDESQMKCVLAHEMAHLRAGDPGWLLVYELWTCLFFFQPLLLVARRRLRELAEFRCDAWVVAQTGDRVGMARTLVDVAEWISDREPVPHGLAPAMALRGSLLASRVRRILDAANVDTARRRWLLAPALCSLLAGLSLGVPGVRLAGGEPEAMAGATVRGPIQAQLIVLERDIAGLHSQLAEAWLLLEGRDLPRVTAVLQSTQRRLQQMTQVRMALWREATARAPATKQIHRARWKSDDSKSNTTEKAR